QLVTLTVLGIGAIVALFQTGAIADYQMDRIKVLFDPTVDPQGIGYNLAQSKLAIGSGQLFGKGLFQGEQTNFQYVPEQETDFIFTAVAEQLGFIGGVVVLVAFMVLLWRVLGIASHAPGRVGALLAGGAAALFKFPHLSHIRMAVGRTP